MLTHGFVLDEKGYKMSKSLGNVVDPKQIIEGGNNKKQQPPYGADVLRLWVASSNYAQVRAGPPPTRRGPCGSWAVWPLLAFASTPHPSLLPDTTLASSPTPP